MYPVPLTGRAPWCGGSLWRRRRWRSRALGSRHPGSHRKPRWSAPRTPQAWSVKGQGRPLGQLIRIEQHTIPCWEETMEQGAAGENTSCSGSSPKGSWIQELCRTLFWEINCCLVPATNWQTLTLVVPTFHQVSLYPSLQRALFKIRILSITFSDPTKKY